jgi:hypothetical protein
MKVKVTPSLPEADLVLMRWHMAKAVARLNANRLPDGLPAWLAPAVMDVVVDVLRRRTVISAMAAVHDCEFAGGSEPLLANDVAPLLDSEVAHWRDDVLAVDAPVLRAIGYECTAFDYASRWN